MLLFSEAEIWVCSGVPWRGDLHSPRALLRLELRCGLKVPDLLVRWLDLGIFVSAGRRGGEARRARM